MLEEVLALPALGDPEGGLRYLVGDWLKAADAVQVTVAHLSQQLRRFLDDRAYLENRRISELLRSIEAKALRVRDEQPPRSFMSLHEPKADISVPMARRMYEPGHRIPLVTGPLGTGDEGFDADALFTQFTVDPRRLRAAVAEALSVHSQASLADVVAAHPITQGLSEVVTYLSLADADPGAVFVPGEDQVVVWEDGPDARRAEVPLVVFTDTFGGGDG